MKTSKRVYAALDEAKQDSDFATQCDAIVDKCDGNPDVPNPSPGLTVIRQHITNLRTTAKLAKGGGPAATQNRNVARGQLRSDMRQLKEGVQASADANLERAAAIIEGAGFKVAKRAPRAKQAIAARYGKAPGIVVVVAKAVGRKATYYWEMSTDQAKWSDLPPTMVAQTTVTGLTPTTVYYFRVRTLTRAGMSDWSVVASIIAH
jgi:hypothetical protein